jgi:hypothetical protein
VNTQKKIILPLIREHLLYYIMAYVVADEMQSGKRHVYDDISRHWREFEEDVHTYLTTITACDGEFVRVSRRRL